MISIAIVYAITAIVLAYFVFKRMVAKAYHKGWKVGFHEAVEIYEGTDTAMRLDQIMTENAKRYAEIIQKGETE